MDGSVQFDQGGSAFVLASDVLGNVQLVSNDGELRVAGSRIDGNLQCKQNRPAPTGGGNLVGGNREDQCARL